MSLALGARLGDTFLIGKHTVSLVSIDDAARVTLERDDGRRFTIHTGRMTKVLPEVYFGVGSKSTTHKLRLLIDAPRTIEITRGKLASVQRESA
jgi:hypothetical protein